MSDAGQRHRETENQRGTETEGQRDVEGHGVTAGGDRGADAAGEGREPEERRVPGAPQHEMGPREAARRR